MSVLVLVLVLVLGSKPENQKPKNQKTIMANHELILENVRLSYPHLWKAKSVMGSDPKYSAAFILDKEKDAKMIARAKDAVAAVLAEAKKRVDADKICLKDGSTKDDIYGSGVFFINSSSDDRPQVVDRGKHPVAEEDDIIYGGCFVNAILNLWFQDNQWGRRVNASLEAVQFVRDGDRFGRKPVDVNAKLPDLSGEDNDGVDPNDPLK